MGKTLFTNIILGLQRLDSGKRTLYFLVPKKLFSNQYHKTRVFVQDEPICGADVLR
jgi:hypothetical protein